MGHELPHPIDLAAVRRAAGRIAPHVHRTPVLTSHLVNQQAGCQLFFKCENLQRSGAFKARGAHNAVFSLPEKRRKRGVATHSSGNHGAALALAASGAGISAYVVMPDNAPTCKIEAVRAYGGEVRFCEPTLAAREAELDALCHQTGATFVPPFDDPAVIAGQGSCVLELVEQLAEPVDSLLMPVGGGGLLAGSAVAAAALWPDCAVIGAEPAGADDAARSFASGVRQSQLSPRTIADGLRTSLGALNFALIQKHVTAILTVDDADTIAAMRLIWTRMKLLVEPSAAVPLAVVLTRRDLFAGQRVAIVLSGGNADIDALPW
ncbi:MAG: pyridoxal-phosphate dependent enzyme [Pseudomonadota bacterium]